MMRKGKRFTPRLLNKWEFEEGRGQGIHGGYKPWHQITRSDPPSRGRSHLTYCPRTGRLRHQLSDGEQLLLGFALMTPYVIDIREQFKLETHDHHNVLSSYSAASTKYLEKGTVGIAADLGIKHPVVRLGEEKALWRFSTDTLLTVAKPGHALELIALAYKTLDDLRNSRKRDLLRIEQAYWQSEGATWQLITPQQYSRAVADTVRAVLTWVLHPEQVTFEMKIQCSKMAASLNGKPLTLGLGEIARQFCIDHCQAAALFWQTVWEGLLPVDLNRSRFPSEPIRLLESRDFWNQNPIVSRRSACL